MQHRHLWRKTDGQTFMWNEHLAKNPDFVTFHTEQVAPEVIPDLDDFLAPEKRAAKRAAKKVADEGEAE